MQSRPQGGEEEAGFHWALGAVGERDRSPALGPGDVRAWAAEGRQEGLRCHRTLQCLCEHCTVLGHPP